MRPAWLGALVLAACSHGAEPAVWVGNVSRAHLAADQALARGDLAFARVTLSRIVDLPAPAGLADRDRRVVLQDASFRLAVVELADGRPQAAVAAADRGLALGQFRDLFLANLLAARGRARELLGQAEAAATDYHDALLVNQALRAEAAP